MPRSRPQVSTQSLLVFVVSARALTITYLAKGCARMGDRLLAGLDYWFADVLPPSRLIVSTDLWPPGDQRPSRFENLLRPVGLDAKTTEAFHLRESELIDAGHAVRASIHYGPADVMASCAVSLSNFARFLTESPLPDWLVVVDDDTFVNTPRMLAILGTMDASQVIWVGQKHVELMFRHSNGTRVDQHKMVAGADRVPVTSSAAGFAFSSALLRTIAKTWHGGDARSRCKTWRGDDTALSLLAIEAGARPTPHEDFGASMADVLGIGLGQNRSTPATVHCQSRVAKSSTRECMEQVRHVFRARKYILS